VAFILLKAGRRWPESAKQAKIRLANLLKILHISRFEGAKKAAGKERQRQAVVVSANGCIGAEFPLYG
jgi:hypothetical protein